MLFLVYKCLMIILPELIHVSVLHACLIFDVFPGQFGSPPQPGGFAEFNAFGGQPAAPAQNSFDPFGSTVPQPAQQAQPGFAAFGTPPQQQPQPVAQPQAQANFFDAFGSPPASSGGFNAFGTAPSSG